MIDATFHSRAFPTSVMAAINLKMDWKWGYFVALLVFVLLIRTSKRFIWKVYNVFYAWIYSFTVVRRNRQLHCQKEEIFKDLHSISNQMARALCVLEIGAGPGSNFQYLPKGTNIMCLDPNPYFERHLKKNSFHYPDVNLQEFLVGRAEDLSILPNGCVDAVISTSVLCSVQDVELCLAEVKRVLRPEGKFLYIEHVCAETNTWLEFAQRWLNPLSKMFSSNCHLTRDIGKYVTDAGFSIVQQEQFDAKDRHLIIKRPHLMGRATK